MLLRGARRHVMGQEVRDATHEADPDEERGESTDGGDGGCYAEHDDGTSEPGGHQRAGPQPDVRRRPRKDRRHEPSHDDQQVSEPAGHVAPSVPAPRALALTGQREDGERRDHDREGAARCDGELHGDAGEAHDQRHHDGRRDSRQHAAGEDRLAAGRSHDPAHPGDERAQHPPHGQVPPGASATDRVPRPGIRLEGRNRTMSMALNTTVPTRPKAAAPAMPSVLRATVHWAGRKATARPAANTMSASTPSRKPAVIGTSRDVARNATTATAVATPSLTPPTVTVRKSERSDTTGAAVTDMLRCSSPIGSGGRARHSNLSAGSHRANTSKTARSVMAHAASARYIRRWWSAGINTSRRRYQGTSTASHAASGTPSNHARTLKTAAAQPNSPIASVAHPIATPRLARKPRSRARVRSPRRRSSSI